MNRSRLKSRSNLSISLALLLLILPASVMADSLRAFSASYNLYRGGLHIANTELRLERAGDIWRWRLSTKARGVFSWFSRKHPQTETTFYQDENHVRLQQITISDSADEKKFENADFDWVNGQLNVLRKGKQKQLPLNGDVYDFQSIHLLAASMMRQQLKSTTIDFYHKGKLIKSRFVYGGKSLVDVDGRKIESNIYEQVITRSKAKIKYYYDAEHPMLPLRIETLESGKSASIMTIQTVDWTL